jgi:D-beta-D-heptose 7-phosphate kinase/D-beta-D-heptose 1-phosphate adenosyltransferase
MRNTNLSNKILNNTQLSEKVNAWKLEEKTIVFTNGCFDILHKGHLEILTTSASFGDVLVVGINTDNSVKRLKGPLRPVNDESFRSIMLASIQYIDAVILFDEETPINLITLLEPDVLVKGGDYSVEQIVGAKSVLKRGGEVKIVPIVKGFSTTKIIETIQKL